MQEYVLEVRSLSKSYSTLAGPLVVLEDVNLTVAPGETCSIVGPSGSGKTTLLGLCAGLDTPSAGSVSLAGNNLGSMDEDSRARIRNEHVGFVFQNFQLLPTLSALENVMVPAELRSSARPEERAIELLRAVGLGERLRHYPVQLSGGEQQRVALARAFINRPRLLFADEPTGNLDSETAEKIIEAMFELNRTAGTALVLVTHDLDLARRTSKIIRMRSGKVAL